MTCEYKKLHGIEVRMHQPNGINVNAACSSALRLGPLSHAPHNSWCWNPMIQRIAWVTRFGSACRGGITSVTFPRVILVGGIQVHLRSIPFERYEGYNVILAYRAVLPTLKSRYHMRQQNAPDMKILIPRWPCNSP